MVEYAEREITLAEAAEQSGLASGTLRVLIHRGRLRARKRGRDWFITPSSLLTYLESRDRRGRRTRDPRGWGNRG